MPPGDDYFDDAAVADIRRRFSEGADSRPILLPPDDRREPVPYLPIPAVDECGAEPALEWREGHLRDGWPQAVGVSQCALQPGHDPGPHVSLLFVRTGGVDNSRTYATQVSWHPDHAA